MSELREQDVQVGADDKFRARKGPLLGGEELMSWTIKALPHPILGADIGMAIMGSFPFGMLLYGYLGEHDNDGAYFLKSTGFWGVVFIFLLWKGVVRQKNLYHYRITDQGGEVEYWMDFPDMGTFFKWFTGICLFVVICMIAVEPSFFWMLAGPGGMAIVGARSLINWEKEIRYDRFTWEIANWVVIDRKRRLVVITRHHVPDMPFELNYLCFEAFLSKDQIEKFIEIAKQYAPRGADFEEGRWND